MSASLNRPVETPGAATEPALVELARRTAMLGAIGYAATRIIGGRDWRTGIQELLERLGEAMQVSRVSLFETHRGPGGKLVQSCRWDWAEPGLPPISTDPRYQNMSLAGDDGAELDDWALRRQRGEVVQALLRDTTGYTRQVFEEHGTLSFLSVPITVNGAWWGFVGFDECRVERVWSELEIDVLRTAAALIASAIERAEAYEKLRLSEERYALVARGGNDGLYDWHLGAGTAYFSPRLHELLGLPEHALGTDPDAFFRCMIPADAVRVRSELEAGFAQKRRRFEFECRCRCSGRSQWFVSRGTVLYEDGQPVRVVGQLRDISRRKEAEEQLRESEERFRSIAETVPLAVSISRAEDARLLFTNAYWSTIFAISQDQALQSTARDFYDSAEERERLLTSLDDDGGLENMEVRLRRGDGRPFWALMSIRRISYQGAPALLSAITDITELKDAEAALRESESNVRAILETALDAIISTDEAGSILEFNPAAERMFGYRRSAMLGRSIDSTIFPPHARPLRSEALRLALDQGTRRTAGHRLELDAMRADGSTLPVEVAIAVVQLTDRVGFTAFLRDISERKQVESELAAYRESLEQLVEKRTAALADAEARLRAAINAFQGGFALYDPAERLVLANDTCSTLLPNAQPVLQSGAALEELVKGIAAANRLGDAWVTEEMQRFRSGEDFTAERETYEGRWIELRAAHMSDGSLLLIITDISAYRMAEQALRTALAKERQFGQLQREFVSMTSHEFRTPLAIIDTATQRLMRRRESLSGDEYAELGREVRDAVQRMIDMIDGILSSARLDSGEIRFAPQPVSLRDLIREVCRRQSALSPRHDIQLDLDGLPAEMTGDPALLDQVFTNLLSNATKYSPSGGEVTIRGGAEDGWITVDVRDHGVGIPAADMPRIFERFFRARTSTGIAGTGIGLYSVKRLVEMHGGTVALDSREGEGTRVTLRLPTAPPRRGRKA
jgi:PAS domain S-box-containing protein